MATGRDTIDLGHTLLYALKVLGEIVKKLQTVSASGIGSFYALNNASVRSDCGSEMLISGRIISFASL